MGGGLDIPWKGFEARASEPRQHGQRRGVGVCTYLECSGAAVIVDYSIVDDFGVIVNPLTCAGQVMGSAVLHALEEFQVRHIDMPLTPEKVWQAIRVAR